MVNYVEQFHAQIENAEPTDFARLRDEATTKYQELQEKAQPVTKVIEDPDAVAKLRSGGDKDRNLDLLRSEYQVSCSQRGIHSKRAKLTSCRLTLTKSMPFTTLVNTNTLLVTTVLPETFSTTSSFFLLLTSLTSLLNGVNSPPTSSMVNGTLL